MKKRDKEGGVEAESRIARGVKNIKIEEVEPATMMMTTLVILYVSEVPWDQIYN